MNVIDIDIEVVGAESRSFYQITINQQKKGHRIQPKSQIKYKSILLDNAKEIAYLGVLFS